MYIKNLIILIATLFSLMCYTQENVLKYAKKITISDGLAHNGVTCMLEDSRGFIWFGTYEGVNRYDGYQLKTFKNTSNLNLLSSNRIRTLSEDSKGNIWIGTDEGITVFNYEKEVFKKIYSSKGRSGPIVRKVFFSDKNGKAFCITEGDGVLVFDLNYNFLKNYFPDIKGYSQNILFFDGLKLNAQNLILCSSKGVLVYNINNGTFKKVLNQIYYSRSIIRIDKESFLVSKNKGVSLVKQHSIENLSFEKVNDSFKNLQVNSMLFDNDKNLWLGLINGGLLKIVQPNVKKTLNTLKAYWFKDNLQVLRSSALMVSSHNYCWYATFNKGIYKFNLKESGFNYYKANLNDDLGINSNMISTFNSFDKDRVLVSENSGGVSMFNTKTHKTEKLPFKLPIGIKKKERDVFVDSKKNIWVDYIGDNAIYRLSNNAKEYEKITLDNFQQNLQIKGYTEDHFGNIWVTSLNEVYKVIIDQFNKVKGVEILSHNLYFKNNKLRLVRCVYPDPFFDYVWIGSDSEGLFRVSTANTSLKKAIVKQYFKNENKNSIPSNFVTSIVRLPNKDLWIGTEGGGLCKVINSNTQPEFVSFTEEDGLSNNVVKNILYAGNDNLWIATNIGLNKYNIKENKFRKFNVTDGLPFEDFRFSAGKLKNGNFIFSGLEGLCYFKPTKISENEPLPKLQFENFKIFNHTVATNDTINDRVLLPKNLNILQNITLHHNENIFSFDVTSLHFSNTENHKIKYKLHPINKEYIEISSTQKTINYSALPPGEYEFIAQASNSLNQWTLPKKIKITINPSIWNTNFAYFMYLVLILAIVFVVIKVILKIQSLHHKVQIEQIEIDNIKQINEAKLTFFSNISHEIKTPITLISDPLKTLMSKLKGNRELENKLFLMQRQTKKILRLVDQVHDFRKAEANALSLNYARFNFNSFIEDITKDFKQLAISEHKNFNVHIAKKAIIVSADKDKLEKIFDNLINNAFKYTKRKDTITLNYQYNEKDLIISISDTGSGIAKEDLPHVFERFYQSKNTKKDYIEGSGIGLAFTKQLTEMHYGYIEASSEEHIGTEIKLKLPIVKEILDKEVIKEFVLPNENEEVKINFYDKNINLDSIKVSNEFSSSLIYYVEDDYEMRDYGTELLSHFFKVVSFCNGEECMQAMENKWPDVVVSDVQMPKMNGLELCIQIKSNLKTSHIPVILLTALTKIEDHLQGIRDGADAYIKKPFYIQHLITKIEGLLVNRKQLRERYEVGIPLTNENNKNNRNDNAFLEKMYSLIEKNIDNPNFDLNTLSKELYLNRSHFYQKVKVLTNQTPLEILRMYRLKKAAYLLANKKHTVNEVFFMTGFKSRPHFSQVFTKKYGVSPGKYAKSLDQK